MSFDAAELYWPPFQPLYNRLEAIKLEPEAVETKSLKSSLQEYSLWLSKGLKGFKTPNSASKRALETEEFVSVGSQKLPIETGLRSAALAASRALNLDEVQAYILLRRWIRHVSTDSKAAEGRLLIDGQLSPSQLRDITAMYYQERLCLLQSLEDLLWLGEGAAGEGPFGEAVEETLVSLLAASPGLEETTVDSLREILESTADSKSPCSFSGPLQDEATPEVNALLAILMLIYFHPRKQCTPARCLELAHMFHVFIFTQPQYLDWGQTDAQAGGEILLSVKLAALLLLEVLSLDIEKPLEVLALGDQAISPDSVAFLAPDIQRELDAELRSWWPTARAAHSSVFVVWSALLTLGSRAGGDAHAAMAYKCGVLDALCQLSSPHGLHPSAAEMSGTIVLSAMVSVLAAFGLEPQSMGSSDTEAVVRVLSNIFQGQERLCASFWEDADAVGNLPVRHFLEGLTEMFPAQPQPLLRLLSALASGPEAAAAANGYLAGLHRLTCLHSLPDPSIGASADSEDFGVVIAEHALPLPGASALTLPAGIAGDIIEFPRSQQFPRGGDWTAGPHASIESLHMIRWRLTVPEGTAQWVLLCRALEALSAVQGTETDAAAAALDDLDAALGFFAAVCAGDSGTALQLLHVEAPTSAESGARGQDILLLAGHAVTVLSSALSSTPLGNDHGAGRCHAAHASANTLAHAFRLLAAFAPNVPGRVADELVRALGITPLAISFAAQVPGAAAQDTSSLLHAIVSAEGSAGRYPATLVLLQLLSTLLQAGRPSPALAPLVTFVTQRVMPELQLWKFENKAERWHLAAACLSVTRHALLADANASGSPSGRSVAAGVALTLQTDAGASACLLPLLPPEASVLEIAAQNRHVVQEVEAAEKCCVAWLRLIPVLLPPANPDAMLSPEPFLRSKAEGPSPPAATLLSFLVYPYFGTRERALVVRSMHCFATAAAASDVPFIGLLPQGGPKAPCISTAAKAVFKQAITNCPGDACMGSNSMFGAACDVIIAAVRYHPSLLDALLFPADMEIITKETKAIENGEAIAAQKKRSDAHERKTQSTLDDLWTLVQDLHNVTANQPYRAAKTLQVISAMWQSGGPAARAILLLRQQDGFWKAIVGVIESAAAAEPLCKCISSQTDSWMAVEADCWRVTAEAYAIQIVAAEWYMWASLSNSEHSEKSTTLLTPSPPPTKGVPAEVTQLLHSSASSAPSALPLLLKRYCTALPSAVLLEDVQRVAAAAGLQILGTAIQDSALWASLQIGTSFVPGLAAAAQTVVGSFDSPIDAAAGLARRSAELLARGGRVRGPAMHAVTDAMVSLAVVPSRIAADREYGADFAYDASAFLRHVGSALGHACPVAVDLQGWLQATSVAASLEDSRVFAATAVDSLVAILDGQLQTTPMGKSSPSVSTPTGMPSLSDTDVSIALEVLTGAAEAVERDQSNRLALEAGEGGGGGGGGRGELVMALEIEVAGVHAAAMASVANTFLVILSRHSPKGLDVSAVLCAKILKLTNAWLASQEKHGRETPWVDSEAEAFVSISRISCTLLATSLLAVSLAGSLKERVSVATSTSTPWSDDPSREARHILPRLLRLVSEGRSQPLLVPAISLSTALLDKMLSPGVWMPIFKRNCFHMGTFLSHILDGRTPSASEASKSPTTPQEAALLLALQVAQDPSGASLLVDQAVPQVAVALCTWLKAPLPDGGDLLGEVPGAAVDYSNAYNQDGTPASAHRLWCNTLALVGLLAASLPGHAAAQGAALDMAISMDERLQLAIEPPEGTQKQPLTLSMAQEAKYSLFLLRGVARTDGRWRLALPRALPAARRASASLLRFAAERLMEGDVVCEPVSETEIASAKVDSPCPSPCGDWFQRALEACSAAETGCRSVGNGGQAKITSFGWNLAERLCSCVQYALAFQLETAPEVSEAEVATLGPEWVDPGVVRSLYTGFQDAVLGVGRSAAMMTPAGQRVLRSSIVVLKTCLQLLDMMSVRLDGGARQELLQEIATSEDALENPRPN